MTDQIDAISRMRKLLSDADAQISRPYQWQMLHDIRALLDRLDSAEAEVLEQARLNGMGAEREAALLARLDSAERDQRRYQLLRRGQAWSVINGIGDTLRADELDAAIDAALRVGAVGGEG